MDIAIFLMVVGRHFSKRNEYMHCSYFVYRSTLPNLVISSRNSVEFRLFFLQLD